MLFRSNSVSFMSLGRGWKSFTLAQDLQEGHVLRLKFDGAASLFMKAFESTSDSSPSGTDGSDSSSVGGVGATATPKAPRAPMSRRRRVVTKRA